MGYIPNRKFESAEIPDIKKIPTEQRRMKSILKKNSNYDSEKKPLFDTKFILLLLLITIVLII